jgi:hypothetical protein
MFKRKQDYLAHSRTKHPDEEIDKKMDEIRHSSLGSMLTRPLPSTVAPPSHTGSVYFSTPAAPGHSSTTAASQSTQPPHTVTFDAATGPEPLLFLPFVPSPTADPPTVRTERAKSTPDGFLMSSFVQHAPSDLCEKPPGTGSSYSTFKVGHSEDVPFIYYKRDEDDADDDTDSPKATKRPKFNDGI